MLKKDKKEIEANEKLASLRANEMSVAIENNSILPPHPILGHTARSFTLLSSLPVRLVPCKGRGKRKVAFTLAEVLITLGIIGIVAAMTLPALIENHNRKVVETRLQKFYSSMNQAIQRAELDYGERNVWFEDIANNQEASRAWIEKYFVPYLNVVEVSSFSTGISFYPVVLKFADGGSVAIASSNGRDWTFFPGNIEKCAYGKHYIDYVGVCAFAFYYNPVGTTSTEGNSWSFEPFGSNWGFTPAQYKNHSSFGCYNQNGSWHGFCSALIQHNGWKIPEDYPYKVKYR